MKHLLLVLLKTLVGCGGSDGDATPGTDSALADVGQEETSQSDAQAGIGVVDSDLGGRESDSQTGDDAESETDSADCPEGTPGCTAPDASNTNPRATFVDGTCVYPQTFQVDVSCHGDFSNVFVNGAFSEWCGNCWAMSDDDLDGIYVFTTDVPKGGVEFKFTVDDTWEVLQPGDECTVTVDEFTNRYVEVTGPTKIAPNALGSCSGCD